MGARRAGFYTRIFFAAYWIALTICWYPVQRQNYFYRMTDFRFGRIAVAGKEIRRRHHHAGRAVAALQAMLLPESLLQRMIGPSRPKPSTVVTVAPSAWAASIVHDLTALPSMSTVQAPQSVLSQPTCVPVSPTTSRM